MPSTRAVGAGVKISRARPNRNASSRHRRSLRDADIARDLGYRRTALRFSRDRHHTICMPTDFDAPLPGEILEVFS